MNKALFFSILLILSLILGCAGKFAVKQTMAKPSQVEPGDDTKIFVVIKGSKEKVANVTATLREYPEIFLSLSDNGENGDEKTGDNIWTYKINIPWEAPTDTYHFDISVYDKSGKEIITKGFEQQSTGRSGTIELIIK